MANDRNSYKMRQDKIVEIDVLSVFEEYKLVQIRMIHDVSKERRVVDQQTRGRSDFQGALLSSGRFCVGRFDR